LNKKEGSTKGKRIEAREGRRKIMGEGERGQEKRGESRIIERIKTPFVNHHSSKCYRENYHKY
jgi:hypothetical protein